MLAIEWSSGARDSKQTSLQDGSPKGMPRKRWIAYTSFFSFFFIFDWSDIFLSFFFFLFSLFFIERGGDRKTESCPLQGGQEQYGYGFSGIFEISLLLVYGHRSPSQRCAQNSPSSLNSQNDNSNNPMPQNSHRRSTLLGTDGKNANKILSPSYSWFLSMKKFSSTLYAIFLSNFSI